MMRAAYFLAAVTAVGAIAGSAYGQRAALAFRTTHSGQMVAHSGHMTKPQGWRVGPAFRNGAGRFGFRNRGSFGRGGAGFGGLIGYGGLPGYGVDALDNDEDIARDSGFFYGEGDVQVRGGEARYAYDRAYPYDWYRGQAERPATRRIAIREDSPRSVHCESEHMVRVCRGD
jgi:hypothetical protein